MQTKHLFWEERDCHIKGTANMSALWCCVNLARHGYLIRRLKAPNLDNPNKRPSIYTVLCFLPVHSVIILIDKFREFEKGGAYLLKTGAEDTMRFDIR